MLIPRKHSGYARDGRRIYRKGGGGGDPPDYEGQRVAERNAQRDAFYKGVGYGDSSTRESQYDAMGTDISNFRKSSLDKEFAEAQRQLGFNMARSGLSGSSQDVYEQGKLRDKYSEAMKQTGIDVEGAKASSRMGYESAVSQGVQLINSGAQAATEIASALQKATSAMQQALEGAKGASYGGFFNSIGSSVENNTIRNAAQTGMVGALKQDDKTVSAVGGGSTGTKGRTF